MTLDALATCRCPPRSVDCRDQAGHPRIADGVPRIPTWERRRSRRPKTTHGEEPPVEPVSRGASVESRTRMPVGKPCRRGRRRSRGCPHWGPFGVRPDPSDEPDRLEHANDGPPAPGSAAVMPLMRAGMPALKYGPCSSGTCPGSMGLAPAIHKEGAMAAPVVPTPPRHGPGECRSAHPRTLRRHRSR